MTLHFLAGYVLGEHGRQSARLATQSGARAGSSLEDLLDVEDRIDRLVLVLAAMWSLLEEQGLTTEQLAERMQAIDEADGQTDGKITPQANLCRDCGAKVAARLDACQFCGAAVSAAVQPGPFDAL